MMPPHTDGMVADIRADMDDVSRALYADAAQYRNWRDHGWKLVKDHEVIYPLDSEYADLDGLDDDLTLIARADLETLQEQRDQALQQAEDWKPIADSWRDGYYEAEQRAAAWRAVALLSLLLSVLLLAAALLAAGVE